MDNPQPSTGCCQSFHRGVVLANSGSEVMSSALPTLKFCLLYWNNPRVIYIHSTCKVNLSFNSLLTTQKALFTSQAMKTLHNKCLLVHADLSEYNLLWHEEKVWFIDVSQAVDVQHPKAFEFLYRDCINIVTVRIVSDTDEVQKELWLFFSIKMKLMHPIEVWTCFSSFEEFCWPCKF